MPFLALSAYGFVAMLIGVSIVQDAWWLVAMLGMVYIAIGVAIESRLQ